jgi:hypothetical protein
VSSEGAMAGVLGRPPTRPRETGAADFELGLAKEVVATGVAPGMAGASAGYWKSIGRVLGGY